MTSPSFPSPPQTNRQLRPPHGQLSATDLGRIAPPQTHSNEPPSPLPPPKQTASYDRRTGSFQPTELGRIASHYYVTHTTLAAFADHLRPTMGDIELLRLFALADEFK
jgi:hypothetical protein